MQGWGGAATWLLGVGLYERGVGAVFLRFVAGEVTFDDAGCFVTVYDANDANEEEPIPVPGRSKTSVKVSSTCP